ncbi:MAG: hypothetical protein A2151_04390 [Candidatus Muproteobacteria bacterium RBG_16_65_34]|uniref:Carbon storage regulator n=1 Tax=Candidatus Muproteobacteria bacterium RBG_16_65_34 TaxID=1817760 RepID=A0A1F6TR83_9PROT|nr:MAG: hypothetical protein A2151_04390 [Candidatus Muproteobacteria bacterium RBG_16_65_34]
MLVLTRKLDEGILIDLDPSADPSMPAGELFANGPIEIRVVDIATSRVKLAVGADRRLFVRRDELDEKR